MNSIVKAHREAVVRRKAAEARRMALALARPREVLGGHNCAPNVKLRPESLPYRDPADDIAMPEWLAAIEQEWYNPSGPATAVPVKLPDTSLSYKAERRLTHITHVKKRFSLA